MSTAGKWLVLGLLVALAACGTTKKPSPTPTPAPKLEAIASAPFSGCGSSTYVQPKGGNSAAIPSSDLLALVHQELAAEVHLSVIGGVTCTVPVTVTVAQLAATWVPPAGEHVKDVVLIGVKGTFENIVNGKVTVKYDNAVYFLSPALPADIYASFDYPGAVPEPLASLVAGTKSS